MVWLQFSANVYKISRNKILPAQALKMREQQGEYFGVIKVLEDNFQETEV